MATTLKLQLGDDIRRLSISQFTTYPEFCHLVHTIFNISNLSGLKLSYQDEDFDWINIRSDLDMAEAKRFAAQLPSFKVRVSMIDGISSLPSNAKPSSPELAPEDIDLTNSFADLMTDSMQKVEPNQPKAPSSSLQVAASEAQFHQTLDSICQDQVDPQESIGVLEAVEAKFKKALDAFVEFMESLQLDQRMKKVVEEFEPAFAKFETRVLAPLNEFGQRASRELESEMTTFQHEISQLKERITQRMAQLSSSAPSGPSCEDSLPSAPEPVTEPRAPNAMQDLLTLEEMGFTDRRRNLELLAQHKGDINLVVNALLA